MVEGVEGGVDEVRVCEGKRGYVMFRAISRDQR